MTDILFVQMPFAGVERPSLALGLFTSALRAARIATEALYANITFAETVGLPAYYLVGTASPDALPGDWIFSESAFGSAANPRRLTIGRSHFSAGDELVAAAVEDRGQASLAALQSYLRRAACEFVDQLADDIVRREPKVVACTSMFDQHVASLALLRRVKERAPGILTVIGGPNCAGPMGRATHLSFPSVDFTVTGEFDPYVVPFFTALRAAGGDAERVGVLPPNVLGPADRQQGASLSLPPSTIVHDMDATVVPDYDDYFEQIYSSPLSAYVTSSLPFETSRGCWWGAKQHCTFCGLNAEGMAFRKKTPARAVEEIRTLTTRHGIYRCFATDNIIDMSYFQTVLPELAADDREYRIFYETKANLKREHVQALADAGCDRIQPGIESLHDETLKVMKKGTTACTNIQLLKYCLEFGVVPAWSILCNFPGTEPEWVAEVAMDFVGLFHLPPPIGTTPIRFDRFSPYHQRPGDYGLNLEPVGSYRHVYPLDDAALGDLAYFFRDADGPSPAVTENARISDEMVERWRSEFGGRERPQLIIESDDGDDIRIRDTRSCSGVRAHELRGWSAALLRILDSPTTREGAVRRLQAARSTVVDEGDLCEWLDELLERRLIWRSSTQYVALAIPPPKRPISPVAEVSMGRVDIWKCIRESRRGTFMR